MLVLSRKAGERISIGPDIEVTVLGIHKGRVKLGFFEFVRRKSQSIARSFCDGLGHTRQGTLLPDRATRETPRECEMIDNLDGLILLLLRTSGMHDAVLAYEEETGASHAEATTAVRKLAQQNGLDHRARTWKIGVAMATAVTIGVVGFLVMIRSS